MSSWLVVTAPPSPSAPRFFARIEAPRGGVAEAPDGPAPCVAPWAWAASSRSQRPRRSRALERGHVGRLPVEVDGDDGRVRGVTAARPRSASMLSVRGSRLHRARRRADAGHGEPGRDVGVGRNDDLVARPDPQGAQREFDGVEPVADADAVRGLDEGGELGLEGLDFSPRMNQPLDRTRSMAWSSSGRTSAVAAARSRKEPAHRPARTDAEELVVVADVVRLVVALGGEHQAHRAGREIVEVRQTIGGT